MILSRKHISLISVVVVALLSVPLVAMQFTSEVLWQPMDFLIAGGLLFLTGIGISSVAQWQISNAAKGALLLLGICALSLIWVQLAVGLF